jgi:hypothetical protein
LYRYAEAGALRRIVRQASTSRPLAWFAARILHRVDHLVYRATRGRITFSMWASGLPVVLLTTTGPDWPSPHNARTRNSGGSELIVIASNFGRRNHPARYHNLRAALASPLG